MRKIVIVCGGIAGLIVSATMMLSTGMCYASGNFEGSMLLGYASMVLAFSLVFVGIRNYRDKYNQGSISFGKAFKTGFFIILLASTMYVLVWLVNYYFFIPDFADKYSAYMLDKLKAGGASQLEIDEQAKEMASFNVLYKNPFFNALITYTEILPVGLLVTLVSALVLKRKPKPVA